MPTPYIEKLAKQGHGSVPELEKKWDDAKAEARSQGKGTNWAYITEIFNRMVGASTKEQAMNFAARVLATRVLNPTPVTWVYVIDGPDAHGLTDYLRSGATDRDRIQEILDSDLATQLWTSMPEADPQDFLQGSTDIDLQILHGQFVVIVFTLTCYDDRTGGTDIPAEVETTDELLNLYKSRGI